MSVRRLPPVDGYDGTTQRTVATFAASLDDQLRRLRQEVEGLEVHHLEWQECPGRNTIGMLLAHLAAVEVAWLRASAQGIPWKGEGEEIVRGVLGVEDDGFPLPTEGEHPACLRGLPLETYLGMLRDFRAIVAREVAAGKDLEAIVAAQPTAELDARFGDEMFPADQFTEMVYRTLPKPSS